MADRVRISMGNLLIVGTIAILAVGFTVWVLRWLANLQIPVLSHLAVGGQTFVGI